MGKIKKSEAAMANRESLIDKFKKFKHPFKSIPHSVMFCLDNPHVWKTVSIAGLSTREFNTFSDWVEYKAPWGLETSMEILEVICKKEDIEVYQKLLGHNQPQAKHGEIGNGRSRGDNITSTIRGDSPTYKIRRLQRDHPALAAKVLAGELSAHRAAIEAGFVKDKASIIPTPEGVARYVMKHFSEGDIELLIDKLN